MLQPTLYIDWAKQLCSPYGIITLHEVKDICASNKLLPHAAAPRTNHGLSKHQRNNDQNNINDWTFTFLYTTLEPVHEFLVLNAHVEGHSLNMHGQLLSGVRCLNFGLNLYLHSFYVCASSGGPGDAASKRMRVLEMTDQIFNMY